MKRNIIGSVLLVEHSGKPTEWTIQKTGDNDLEHLFDVFETAKGMCSYELGLGGTLKLLNASGSLLREQCGRVS